MFISPYDGIHWTRSWEELQNIYRKMREDRKRNWLYR